MVVYTAAQPPKASIFESELARCTKMLCDGGIPKRTRLKGYANRKGYALFYLDIARFFFFPKHTIRLYFNSRLRRSKRAVCEHSAGTWGGVKGSLV